MGARTRSPDRHARQAKTIVSDNGTELSIDF
jgi:hypothetical protein